MNPGEAFSGLLADGWGGGGEKKDSLPKICHTHPTMIKLRTVLPYLNANQNIYK